jgi:uncharacterized ferredoxin-like protein
VEATQIIAELMRISARTAPKTKGEDFLQVQVVDGPRLDKLAAEMEAYGLSSHKSNFDRDAASIRGSAGVVLIGLKDASTAGLNCGACGYPRCKDLPAPIEGSEFRGPFCAYRLMDLGIALGSAAKTASALNADSRIMYRAGVLARRMGLIDADVVIAIPIAATGKSIYFDRA